MNFKAQLDGVLKTFEKAVQTHLEEEQRRVAGLVAKINEATANLSVLTKKDADLIAEIDYATQKLTEYKPMTVFTELSKGGKRMKRSRRSNRGRKSVRK